MQHVDKELLIAGPVVFFTGAGISVGAGLPTYRGTGGLYEDTGLEPPNAGDVTPERLPGLWNRFRPRLTSADEISPSRAHHHIAEIETQSDEPVTVVTQNVDGLHQAAGSTRVVELHGTLRTMRCLGQKHVTSAQDIHWDEEGVARCPQCGDMCRPNVVLFGESLPAAAWADAEAAIYGAATIVAVGTTAAVYPAASLISARASSHAVRIWVNPESEPPDHGWTWLQGSADEMVPRLQCTTAD